MNLTNMLIGLVFITMIFIAIHFAIPSISEKKYIKESDMNQMEQLGKQYVSEAKPSGLSSVFLYFSSALAAIKTTFNMVTYGIPLMISDIFTYFGFPSEFVSIVIGLVIFIIALYVLSYITGKQKQV